MLLLFLYVLCCVLLLCSLLWSFAMVFVYALIAESEFKNNEKMSIISVDMITTMAAINALLWFVICD